MNGRAWRQRICDQRGSSVVEYVGVTGIALITAGLIIAAIVAGRFQIGAAMAGIHDQQIRAFEAGATGQANTNAALYPPVRAPKLVVVRSLPSLTLAVPQLVVETGILPVKPVARQPTLAAAVVAVPDAVSLPDSIPVQASAVLFLTLVGATVVALLKRPLLDALPDWLRAVVQVLISFIIGVVALLVVALAIVAIFSVALEVAIAIAAVILLLGFGIWDYWTRSHELLAVKGRLDGWEYAQLLGVTLLSLVGIGGIIEAIRGQRLLSDLALSPLDRWTLGFGGLLQLAFFAVGLRMVFRPRPLVPTDVESPGRPGTPAQPEPPVEPPVQKPPQLGPLEGWREYDVYDPANPGRRITDIDSIEGNVLWEEKSAVNAIDRITGEDTTANWIKRNITAKFEKYLEARQYINGYTDAQIGFRFTTPHADPVFRAAVEAEIARLGVLYPNVPIVTEWR